jgi:SET domain
MLRLVATLFAAASSAADDHAFHSWCTTVAGIQTPAAILKTTSDSVAGRGVFATRDVREGEVVVEIPERSVLHEFNAAFQFPKVAKDFVRQQKKYLNRERWWWRLLFLGRQTYKDLDHEDIINSIWSAELTAYCLAAIESDHPWAEW